MRVEILVLGIASIICISYQADVSKKCYHAKTCIHDGKEKCGEDKSGKVRRFLDSCDIKEYNCLREASFVKTSSKKCQDLPPIDKNDVEGDNISSVNESDHPGESENENKISEPDGAIKADEVGGSNDVNGADSIEETEDTKKLIGINTENEESKEPENKQLKQ